MRLEQGGFARPDAVSLIGLLSNSVSEIVDGANRPLGQEAMLFITRAAAAFGAVAILVQAAETNSPSSSILAARCRLGRELDSGYEPACTAAVSQFFAISHVALLGLRMLSDRGADADRITDKRGSAVRYVAVAYLCADPTDTRKRRIRMKRAAFMQPNDRSLA